MSRRIVAGLIVWLVCQTAASVLAGQDTFPSARELYLSADYEGALAILDHLVVDAHDGRTAVAEYRVFCLLTLDRSDEARQAIKVLFEMDPFYQPSDLQVSPRVRTVLEDARKAFQASGRTTRAGRAFLRKWTASSAEATCPVASR